MMSVNGKGKELRRVPKRMVDTNGKFDKRAKRLHLTLLGENTKQVVEPKFFAGGEAYNAKSVKGSTLHGDVYQWKHMMLLVHRAHEKDYSYCFATEMEAAGDFDDAVLEYQDPVRGKVHRFLQFKHAKVHKRIKVDDLLETNRKKPFGILKYFNSWQKINNNPIFNESNSKDLILCTNQGLDVEGLESKDIKVTEIEVEDFLKVTVKTERTPRFYKFSNQPSDLRCRLESVAHASDGEISKFFEEFILAVNQPNEIELGTMIGYELGASHQFNLHNVDFIRDSFQNFMVNLLKETERHSKFLSHQDTAALFEELHRRLSSHITIGLMLSYSIELKDYDIKFNGENSDLREFLVPSNSLRNSILKLTFPDPTLLTALRVYQAVEQLESYEKRDSWIFIRLEKLLLPDIRDQIFCAFESSISHDLLVVDCELFSNNEFPQILWIRLVDILEKIPSKKLILIIQENESSTVHETRHKTDDEISIIDLAECSRQKLLKKSIIEFQGHEERTSFGEIFGIYEFDNIELDKLLALKKIIKKETLSKLIQGKEIVIGTKIQGLGNLEKYYIPRTIIEHRVIEAKILKNSEIPDLFAIGGIDRETLEKLVVTENINHSLDKSNLKKLDSDKCYILQGGREADHFRDICKQNPNRNVHWLQGESGALIWQQSLGSITNLRAFRNTSMDHDNNKRPEMTGLTENQLADHDNKRRIVILSDTAGMGKSTVLTRLAEIMKQNEPSLLIIEVNLTQHTGVLCKEKEERTFGRDDTDRAVDFLVDRLLNLREDYERNIFKGIVKVTCKTAVLIDGYDEICPDYGDIVIDLLRSLAKLRIKRLFVTTKPHTSVALEQELVTFSHVLQPFSQVNQMDFLTKFWGSQLNSNDSSPTIEENLKEHASKLLKISIKLINPRMLQFTGIPLETKLVAEAFPYGDEEKLEQFYSSKKSIYTTDLYERFVDKKFEICLKKKMSHRTNKVGLQKYRNAVYRIFLMSHQKLALKALFDEDTVTALIRCQPEINETFSSFEGEEDGDEDEERNGIVTQVVDGKPRFVHSTYAEYFAAAFLSNLLKYNGCDPQVQKFFVAELLVEPMYVGIRAFLNCLLCREDHAPEMDSWRFDLSKNRNTRDQTLYHVATEEHNTGIVNFFSIRLGRNR